MCRITTLTSHSQKNGVRFTRKLCQKVLSLSLYPSHSEVGCVLNWKSWTISYFMSSSFLFLSLHLHFFSAKWLCDLHNSWWCQIWPNLQLNFDIFRKPTTPLSRSHEIFHYFSSALKSSIEFVDKLCSSFCYKGNFLTVLMMKNETKKFFIGKHSLTKVTWIFPCDCAWFSCLVLPLTHSLGRR